MNIVFLEELVNLSQGREVAREEANTRHRDIGASAAGREDDDSRLQEPADDPTDEGTPRDHTVKYTLPNEEPSYRRRP